VSPAVATRILCNLTRVYGRHVRRVFISSHRNFISLADGVEITDGVETVVSPPFNKLYNTSSTLRITPSADDSQASYACVMSSEAMPQVERQMMRLNVQSKFQCSDYRLFETYLVYFLIWFWWRQLAAGRSLKFASCRVGWRERSGPRSAGAAIHSVALDRTPDFPHPTTESSPPQLSLLFQWSFQRQLLEDFLNFFAALSVFVVCLVVKLQLISCCIRASHRVSCLATHSKSRRLRACRVQSCCWASSDVIQVILPGFVLLLCFAQKRLSPIVRVHMNTLQPYPIHTFVLRWFVNGSVMKDQVMSTFDVKVVDRSWNGAVIGCEAKNEAGYSERNEVTVDVKCKLIKNCYLDTCAELQRIHEKSLITAGQCF